MNKNCTNKLLKALGCNTKLKPDIWTKERTYYSIGCYNPKKWIANIIPSELLQRDLKQTVESIATLCESNIFYENFPDIIETPNYGDNWGRLANYIELNNRAIAEMNFDRTCCGILSCIKLLPAIPPSAKNWANCIIISQIFPNIYGDSYNKGPFEENSIYGIKLNAGYSDNIINYEIADKISSEEQLKAFNDLAHFRGIKTGFRTVISADQIKVSYPDKEDETFSWCRPEHVEMYINESVKLMNLGFEAMFIDSAKHIGGYDCEHYTGVGDLPEYHQMQYILHEIRARSGKTTISFVGEKSSDDFERYRLMGLNAGTDFITGDDFYAVRELSEKLKYNRVYAPGVEIENDNYEGGISYEQRLNRINTALFAYYLASDKLPSFMQTNDIFPLRYDTNTHHIMMTNPSYSQDGSPESHWSNLFAKDDGRLYNHKAAELFAHALCL
ncbi:MAG: hypothetical protein LUH11_02780 [Candidatus Gastranaerophilales bacterium]|nr:hypothetical protein [Candidatus Gastranaerophilales bacterium]